MEPTTLCSLASSCEEARQLDATHYEGIVRLKLALVSLHVRFLGEVLESRPGEYMRVAVEGHSQGTPGSFHGIAELHLYAQGPVTEGRYRIEGHVLGPVGSLAGPFLQPAAQRAAQSFAGKVSRYLAAQG